MKILSAIEAKTGLINGFNVTGLNSEELVSFLLDAAESPTRGGLVFHHNVHSLYLASSEPRLREVWGAADICFVDGIPIALLARQSQEPLTRHDRTTGIDWLPILLQASAQRGLSVVHVGGKLPSSQRVADMFTSQFPGLRFVVLDGFFDVTPGSMEGENVVAAISRLKPDILLVGMGMPRQECWSLENRARLNAGVVVSVGATLEYFAGTQRTPPRFLGPLGLEGVFRLLSHPRRNWRRYLVEPVALTFSIVTRDMASRLQALWKAIHRD